MLLDGKPIGVITVTGAEAEAFSQRQIELLQTFADQAVIAVENVRLFTELKARTAALTRSVEQLTALGEVGRAVSSTLDLETVLTTIVSRAVQLSRARRRGGAPSTTKAPPSSSIGHRPKTGGPALAGRSPDRRGSARGKGRLGQTAITLEPVQVPDITVPGAYVGPNQRKLDRVRRPGPSSPCRWSAKGN